MGELALAGLDAAAVAALVLGGWLASTLVLWWDTGAIGAARVEKRQLQLDVAELRASRDEWVKTRAVVKLTRCNPGNRPCVWMDERAGSFESEGHAGYRVIQGY